MKGHNRFQPGDVLKDVFRSDALELIEAGIAKEVETLLPPVFVKHDWKGEAAAEVAAKIEKSKGEEGGKRLPVSNPNK